MKPIELKRQYKSFEEGWNIYTMSKAGVIMGDFKGWACTPDIYSFERACNAAESLKGKYDHVIEIARDGLWLGYILTGFGNDVLTVRMSREGLWQPMQEIERLEGKVLLCDLDVLSGGTIHKAYEKTTELGAEQVDVLLQNAESALTVGRLKEISMTEEQKLRILQQDCLGAESFAVTDDGLKINYWAGERSVSDYQYIIIDARKMMPEGVKCSGLMDFPTMRVPILKK